MYSKTSRERYYQNPIKNSAHATKHLRDWYLSFGDMYSGRPPVLYFVTTVYRGSIPDKTEYTHEEMLYNDIHPGTLWRKFDRLYIKMNKWTIGRNFHRRSKRKFQPLTYSYIDSGNSRVAGNLNHAGVDAYCNPHIHSVMLIHPDMVEKYEDLFEDFPLLGMKLKLRALFPDLQSADVKKVELSDLGKVHDYSSKYLRKAPRNVDRDQLWQIHPKSVRE